MCTQQTGIGVDKISYINNCKPKLVINPSRDFVICNFTLDLMDDESSVSKTTTSEFDIATNLQKTKPSRTKSTGHANNTCIHEI